MEKKHKFRKGRLKKLKYSVKNLKFGTIGLQAAQSGIIKSNQLLAAKQYLLKKIKKKGKLWINVFANLTVTSKPIGTRMGKGKGSISHWIAKVRCGEVLFEICSFNNIISFSALKTVKSKLPVKTKIIF